jgi:hypothetical protein
MEPYDRISDYCQRSGDAKIADTQYWRECDEGFAGWNVTDDAIVVIQCYGDGLFWLRFFKEMTKGTEYKIRFMTRRNPKAFARRMGARVIGHIMEIE